MQSLIFVTQHFTIFSSAVAICCVLFLLTQCTLCSSFFFSVVVAMLHVHLVIFHCILLLVCMSQSNKDMSHRKWTFICIHNFFCSWRIVVAVSLSSNRNYATAYGTTSPVAWPGTKSFAEKLMKNMKNLIRTKCHVFEKSNFESARCKVFIYPTFGNPVTERAAGANGNK